MPRVNYVKKAQQRYATRPVIDPATGEQKVTPVMRSNGQPKLTKSGRPVVLRVTERDLERPLPMPTCDYPGCTQPSREIAVGTPYKWIEPSGQRVRTRHAACPTWNVWEYSSSLSARIAQITSEDPGVFESIEDAQSWLEGKAQEIRDLAEEKRESATNIEDGFGHPTYQSDELNQTADDLESWADDVEGVDLPEYPEGGSSCDECSGTGKVDAGGDGIDSDKEMSCDECGGSGTLDDPTEDEISTWQEELTSAIDDVLGNCPV